MAQDPSYPAHAPFGETFGYPFQSSHGTHYVRPFHLQELATAYSIPPDFIRALSKYPTPQALQHLSYCLPFSTASTIANTISD